MNVNVAAITSGAFRAIADAHADGSALIGRVATPVGFMANTAGALGRDFVEAVRYEWLPQRSGAVLGLFRVYLRDGHEVEM